jgi:hypothetical protein
VSCDHSTCPEIEEKSTDLEKRGKLITSIVSLIEGYLSFIPEESSHFRDRYYLSNYCEVMKDILIILGKKIKSDLSYAEIKKIGMDIINKIEWEDINRSQLSNSQLQEICNQNSKQIIVLSFESARNSLLSKGEPDNQETSKKAIDIVRKKFPNVPIQFQETKEESENIGYPVLDTKENDNE